MRAEQKKSMQTHTINAYYVVSINGKCAVCRYSLLTTVFFSDVDRCIYSGLLRERCLKLWACTFNFICYIHLVILFIWFLFLGIVKLFMGKKISRWVSESFGDRSECEKNTFISRPHASLERHHANNTRATSNDNIFMKIWSNTITIYVPFRFSMHTRYKLFSSINKWNSLSLLSTAAFPLFASPLSHLQIKIWIHLFTYIFRFFPFWFARCRTEAEKQFSNEWIAFIED